MDQQQQQSGAPNSGGGGGGGTDQSVVQNQATMVSASQAPMPSGPIFPPSTSSQQQQQQQQQQHELLQLQGPTRNIVSQSVSTETTKKDIQNTTDLRKAEKKKCTRKRPRYKKPKDMPRRPLSAYNIFFKQERARIINIATAEDDSSILDGNGENESASKGSDTRKTRALRGKIGFENLAKMIGNRWKNLNPSQLEQFKALALEEAERYRCEMKEYHISQGEKKKLNDSIRAKEKSQEASISTKGEKHSRTTAETHIVTTEVEEKRGKCKLRFLNKVESTSSLQSSKRPGQYQQSNTKRTKLNNQLAHSSPRM